MNLLQRDYLSPIALAGSLILVGVDASLPAIIALCLALLNHNAKKFFEKLQSDKELSDVKRLDALQAQVSKLSEEIHSLSAAQSFKTLR